MRHRMQKNSSFGVQRSHRGALLRNLVKSLMEHERIKTTLPRAKALKSVAEKAITMGKKKKLHAQRLLFQRHPCKKTVHKIMTVLSPRFRDRPGGYTRIIRLGPRAGDKAPLAYVEFVDYQPMVKKAAPQVKKPSAPPGEGAKPVYTKEQNRLRKKRDKKAFTKRKRRLSLKKSSRRQMRGK